MQKIKSQDYRVVVGGCAVLPEAGEENQKL
jgi:hypothetical protein